MEESFSLEEVVLARLPEKVAGAKDEVGSETRAPCLAGSTLESHREKPFVLFCLNLNCVCIVLYCVCSDVVDPREPPRAVGDFVSPEFDLCLHCECVVRVRVHCVRMHCVRLHCVRVVHSVLMLFGPSRGTESSRRG